MPLADRITSLFGSRLGSLGPTKLHRRASEVVHSQFPVDCLPSRLPIPDNHGSPPQPEAISGKTAAPRKRRIIHRGNWMKATTGHPAGSELLPNPVPDLQTEIHNSRAYRMRRSFDGDSLSGDSDELMDRWSVGTRESGRSVRSLPIVSRPLTFKLPSRSEGLPFLSIGSPIPSLESPIPSLESHSLQQTPSWPSSYSEAKSQHVDTGMSRNPFSWINQVFRASPPLLYNRNTEPDDIESERGSMSLPPPLLPRTGPTFGTEMPHSQFPRLGPYNPDILEPGPAHILVFGSLNNTCPNFEPVLNPGIANQWVYPAGPPKPSTTEVTEYLLKVTYQDRHTIHPSDGKCAGMWLQQEVIGQGGQGTVFLEQCSQTLQLRAVKRIPGLVLKANNLDIARELRAMIAVIEFEEHFVKFYGWYKDPAQDSMCIAMEYLPCGDLKHYLKNHPIQARLQASIIAKQLLRGLCILHKNLICHRDLKPQNVLISSLEPLRVKLADFGLAKSTLGTQLRTRFGTMNYMAPELLGLGMNQTSYTSAVDMWALGCLLHELITSKTPFEYAPDDDIPGISGISGRADNQPSIDMDLLFEFTKGRLELPVHMLKTVGAAPTCIMFISQLLVAQPQLRITPAIALHDLCRTTDFLDNQWIISKP